jgi:hypothetical protein
MKKPKAKPVAPPELLIALSKLLEKPDALAAGEYPVRGQAILAVDSMVCVGEAGDAKATVKVDAGKLLAAYLHLANVELPPPDEFHKLLRKAFALAAIVEPKEPYRAKVALTEDTLGRCKEELAITLPRIPRAGAVRVPGTCEVVEWRAAG